MITTVAAIIVLVEAGLVGVFIGWYVGHRQGYAAGVESGLSRGYLARELELEKEKWEAQRAKWAAEDAEYAERRRIDDEEWQATRERWAAKDAVREDATEAELVRFPEWTDAELAAINESLNTVPGPEVAR